MINLKETTSALTPADMDKSKDSYQWVYSQNDNKKIQFGTDSYFTVTYNIPSAGTYTILNSTLPYAIKVDKNEKESFPTSKQYTFDSEGIHTVKFFVTKNRTSLGSGIFSGVSNIVKISFEGCELPKLKQLSRTLSSITSSNIEIDVHGLKNNKQTDLQFMCLNSRAITSINAQYLDVSECTHTNSMFNGCSNLKSVGDLSKWKTATISDLGNMFNACTKLTTIGDLSKWDTHSFTTCLNMFYHCYNIISIGDLSKWNVSNVTSMSGMFLTCKNLVTTGDLSNWQISNVQSMGNMFSECSKLTFIGDLSNWDTSKVTTMEVMFWGCTNLNNLGIPPIPSACTTTDMFLQCSGLTNITASGIISNSVSFSNSPLTHDSAMVLINALDENVSGKTLTLKASTLNTLTDEEKARGTNKGWEVIGA